MDERVDSVDVVEEFRAELVRLLDRGGKYERRDSLSAALSACAEQSEIQLDLMEDDTVAERRLHDFGRRLRVAVISVKTDIEPDELHRFVSLVHEHHRGALSLAATEQAARLAAHGEKGLERTLNVIRGDWEKRSLGSEIRALRSISVSFVASDELVDDDRRLPRQVRIAMSRLSKDLWMTTRLGDRLLLDIVRPLDQGDELRSMLVHLDVIESSELRPELLRVLWAQNRGDRQLLDHMRALLQDEVITVDNAPDDVQRLLARERKQAWCRENPEEFIAALDIMADADTYQENLRVLLAALPDLVQEGGLEQADRIARVLTRHQEPSDEFPWRPDSVETLLTGLESMDLATPIVGLYTSSSSGVRRGLNPLFESMRAPARALLLRILSDTDRRAVATDAALLLQSLVTPNWIVEVLSERKPRPRAAVYLLKILGEVGKVQHAIALKAWLRHGDKAVRDAAIEAAFRLGQQKALPVLLRAVYDPEPEIVMRAMHFLERLDHREPRYLRHLMKLVAGRSRSDDGSKVAPDAVRVAAIETMSRLGSFSIPDGGGLEELLIGLLARPHKRSLTAWRPPEPTVPQAVRIAAADALGKVGGTAAAKRLKDQSGETDDQVKNRMTRALNSVARR
ncbi:MAG: HEAT repeat protein [Myxococcota bacterium]